VEDQLTLERRLAAKEPTMKRFMISALVLCLGFGTARGDDPDPIRAKLELARQRMFLKISTPGASFGEQSQNAAQARMEAQAEFARLLNGTPRPTPLSDKRRQLVGTWRGISRRGGGSISYHESTLDANGIMVNATTVVAPNGAIVSRQISRAQMSYYQDGVAYVTALNGLGQQLTRLAWTDDNHFTLTTPGSHVTNYERVR
jgi:hypothetical protein